jgi:tRNA (cytidine/uridine-2'-O-)-methyltransferase
MRLALYEPDIPQNTGAILRLAACFAVGVDIIEPCGFLLDDKRFRRAGMDYLDHVKIVRHGSWEKFRRAHMVRGGRLVLLTTRGETPHHQFAFRPDDILLLGRESAGVPAAVRAAVDARVRIPMAGGLRSLNVATAAAIGLAEALRQTGGFPSGAPAPAAPAS